MMNVQYVIYVRLETGEEFVAFNWCRSAEVGVARAKKEAVDFGYDNVADVWAMPVAPVHAHAH